LACCIMSLLLCDEPPETGVKEGSQWKGIVSTNISASMPDYKIMT